MNLHQNITNLRNKIDIINNQQLQEYLDNQYMYYKSHALREESETPNSRMALHYQDKANTYREILLIVNNINLNNHK